MKRAHRKTHFWLWLVLTPILAGIIFLAIELRPDAPVNPVLPDVLIEGGN